MKCMTWVLLLFKKNNQATYIPLETEECDWDECSVSSEN